MDATRTTCTHTERMVHYLFWLMAVVAALLWLALPQVAHAQAPDSTAGDMPVIGASAVQTGTASVYLPYASFEEGARWPYPPNREMFVSVNTNLMWDLQDGAGATYSVLFEADDPAPDQILAGGLTVAGVNPPELAMNTRYYWQVISTWPNGRRVPGPIWTFKTEWPEAAPDVDRTVFIPGGNFFMGCDATNPYEHVCSANDYHNDEPVRQVWVDSFYIDKYEVTNREYRACMAAGECAKPRRTDWFDKAEYALAPVVWVSWWDAVDYCTWSGGRLPSEAEWEKAGRGTLDTRVYPWGNEEPDCTRANNEDISWAACGERVRGIMQVGGRPRGASPYGVHDMAGNVFEWVNDKYDVWYYIYSPLVNPPGPPTSRMYGKLGSKYEPYEDDQDDFPSYTLRGGSWQFIPDYLRVSHRHWGHHGDEVGQDLPYFRNSKVGFRCARSK